jgi:hypothetical protein
VSTVRVAAITRDLMDRSKIVAAVEDVTVAGSAGADLGEPDVVLVDLHVAGAVEAALATGARVLGYGSHVDEETLAAARQLGAEVMARSVFFRRLSDGTLLD